MDLIEHFRRQFAYDDWANREVLRVLKSSGNKNPRVVQLMAHILSASRLWLERIEQRPQSLPVWPEISVEQCEVNAEEVARLWHGHLNELSPPGLETSISYKNTKGADWTSTKLDVLTHVVMHGAYHRGQIATVMRGAGETPASTDFIHAVRQGLVE